MLHLIAARFAHSWDRYTMTAAVFWWNIGWGINLGFRPERTGRAHHLMEDLASFPVWAAGMFALSALAFCALHPVSRFRPPVWVANLINGLFYAFVATLFWIVDSPTGAPVYTAFAFGLLWKAWRDDG